MSGILDLYYCEPNTFHLKPLIMLKEMQVDFTDHYYDPVKFEQLAPEFPQSRESRHNQEREGPLLVCGDTVICGSFFMLEFIAEANGGTELYPTDPYSRYVIQEWGRVSGTALGIGVSALGCTRYLAPVLMKMDQNLLLARLDKIEPLERRARWLELIDGSLDSSRQDMLHSRLGRVLRQIEDRLSTSAWLTDKGYSIADIDTYSMIWTLPELTPDLVNGKKTPGIMDYLGRITSRPAVQSAFALSRSGRPQECFVPGIEPSRWLGL